MHVKKGTALSLAWNLSWTMLFSLLLPLLGGIWLDKKLGTAPLFILIGAVLGILAATVGVARMTLRTFSQIVPQDLEQPPGENGKEEPE
ncbi:MAG: AtpZ/AtpI family protein [Anaerolineae bacterium]|jgi:F0F1-type ATP synthase assembly protein I